MTAGDLLKEVSTQNHGQAMVELLHGMGIE